MSTTPTPGAQRTAQEAATAAASNLKGKTYLVTGAYSGIGVETCRALLKEGQAGKVIVVGRNPKLQEEFVAKLQEEEEGIDVSSKVDGTHTMDLADLASVQEFAKYVKSKYSNITLILNAGVMNSPAEVTKQGYEQQFGINCLGHFLLAQSLVDITERQVWVSSSAHRRDNSPRFDFAKIQNFDPTNSSSSYDGWFAYQQSKLGNILLAKEFAKRHPTKLQSASCHPGVIRTNLGRHLSVWDILNFVWSAITRMVSNSDVSGELTVKSIAQGAATTVTVAGIDDREWVQGAYYSNCEITDESESAQNIDDAAQLFELCDELSKSYQ